MYRARASVLLSAIFFVVIFFMSTHTLAMGVVDLNAIVEKIDQDNDSLCYRARYACCKVATNVASIAGMGITGYAGTMSGLFCAVSTFCFIDQNFYDGDPIPGGCRYLPSYVLLGACGVSGVMSIASFKACRALKKNIDCRLVSDNAIHEE